MDRSTLPAVLEVTAAPDADGSVCWCFCGVRHRVGICEGFVKSDAVRILFNSLWNTTGVGVVTCRSCALDYPESLDLP